MARREDVVNSIYEDLDHLSNNALSIYIWSWTNKRCGMAGLYKVPKRMIYEARLPIPEVDEALVELNESALLFYEQNVLWCKGRIKRLSMVGKQIGKSIANDIKDVEPDHPLRLRLIEKYEGFDWWDKFVSPELRVGRGSSEAQNTASTSGESSLKRGSREAQASLRGRGRGSGKGSSSLFNEWLEHFHEVTGRVSVTGSKTAREAFAARLKEGKTLDELKQATVGCQSDGWRVEKGHNVPETILRASNVEGYISQAVDQPRSTGSKGIDQAHHFAEMARQAEADERAAA